MSETDKEIPEAKDPNTPPQRLSKLANSKNDEVRRLVAQNPNTAESTLLALAEAFPVEVTNNPVFGRGILARPDFIQQLARGVALAMASSEKVPESVLELLLSHPTRGVKALVARRHDLSEALMLKMVANSIEFSRLLENPAMTEAVWLAMAAKQEKSSDTSNLNQLFWARVASLSASARAVLEKFPDARVQQALQWRDEAPAKLAPPPLHFDGATDVGLKRSRNEDAFVMYQGESLAFFAVIDGMGGQGTGEVVARLTRESLLEQTKRTGGGTFNAQELLHQSFLAAQDAIEKTEYSMGAAVAALLLQGHTATIAHLGDSRAYILRAGKLTALTEDHSLLNALKKQGHPFTPEQLENFPYKNVITRGLGMDRTAATPELTRLLVLPGDLFLLCTDGISGLGDRVLEETLRQDQAIEQKVSQLIELGNQDGGLDNMAVVLVQVGKK